METRKIHQKRFTSRILSFSQLKLIKYTFLLICLNVTLWCLIQDDNIEKQQYYFFFFEQNKPIQEKLNQRLVIVLIKQIDMRSNRLLVQEKITVVSHISVRNVPTDCWRQAHLMPRHHYQAKQNYSRHDDNDCNDYKER